ncbi:MAG: XRE family transcriptional regulator [Deltaproteobacteria bacterium]|nr:XRE family transcriptional regulator [Deltaproteobacteria bacterium]
MKNGSKKNYVLARDANELGKILGLSESDTALMKYKARLTTLAVKAIEKSKLTVNEIVKRSGVARSKISAVKNGASVSVSCDLLVKIIAAAGLEMAPPKAA